MKIGTKRVYEPVASTDGYRILVDRLWPRGLKKEDVRLDKWVKAIAPSTALRKWFNHDPERWQQFIAQYEAELAGNPALEELRADIRKHKTVTLLFSARDETHNQAIALQKILTAQNP